ncbi:MAG TPA: hypothetical protein VLH61_05360 [Bacteroidales bacterium]|nr:hypothetical protein [Bacteroidales bacterium]
MILNYRAVYSRHYSLSLRNQSLQNMRDVYIEKFGSEKAGSNASFRVNLTPTTNSVAGTNFA